MRSLCVLLLAGALVVAGCGAPDTTPDTRPGTTPGPGSTQSSTASTTAPTATPAATPAISPSVQARSGHVVTSGASQYGRVLFDRSGQAIYTFDLERGSSPRCYAACAEAWPPVLTRGAPRAAGGVRAGLLGTTRRTDGTRQVTYAGHPLYYYAHEPKHVVRCHDVPGFGGLWLAVGPDGRPPE